MSCHAGRSAGRVALTIEEIVANWSTATNCDDGYTSSGEGYPAGYLANQAGAVFFHGTVDQSTRAEELLVTMLTSSHINARYAAWQFLNHPEHTVSEATTQALQAFRNDPVNAPLIKNNNIV